MKHIASILLILLLLILFPAFAETTTEDAITVDIVVTPFSLVEPGTVDICFYITNTGTADIQNIVLSSADGLSSEPLGNLETNTMQAFARTHNVTQAELDACELHYTLSYDDPLNSEHKINRNLVALLSRSDKQPAVELLRRFSDETIAKGDAVTVLYTIKNTGNVPLNSLVLADTLGNYIERLDKLAVNEKKTFISQVTMNDSAVSETTLIYSAEATGETQYSVKLDAKEIQLAESGLEINLSGQKSDTQQDKLDLTLSLKNTGDVRLADICIYDDIYGGIIAEGINLDPDTEAYRVGKSYTLRGKMNFRWHVQGKGANGTKLDLYSNSVSFCEEEETENNAEVQLSAQIDTPEICKAGDVGCTVRIENTGDCTVRKLRLSEASKGELCTFELLAPGDTIERTVMLRTTADSEGKSLSSHGKSNRHKQCCRECGQPGVQA